MTHLESTARDGRNQNLRINVLFLCAAIVLSLYFVELRLTLNEVNPRATAEQLVQGLAPNPFQSRILIPWLIRQLLSLPFIPAGALGTLIKGFEFTSLLLLLVAFRHYLQLLFQDLLLSSLFAFSLFYALPFNYLNTFWYPYDIPSVLFFTLGLIFLYKGHWRWYYPLFVIGTVNRETTLFLTLIFILVNVGRTPSINILKHALVQFLIWVAIRLVVTRLVGASAGLFEWYLEANILGLLQPATLLHISVTGGMSWLLAVIGYRQIEDAFVRRSLFVAIPWFIVMLFVGVIIELRIFGELLPIFLPAALLVLQAKFKASFETG